MIKIRDENFYTVLGWMLNVLELKGNELIVFAIIYSFSQDGESEFTGSLSYLQTFGNIKSHNTVTTILKTLIDKQMIVRRDYVRDNVKRVAYKANMEYIEKLKKVLKNLHPIIIRKNRVRQKLTWVKN